MLTLYSLDIAIHILLADSGCFAGGHNVDVERWAISKRRMGMRRLKKIPDGTKLCWWKKQARRAVGLIR